MEKQQATLGTEAMAAINAVEGLVLSAESRARLAFVTGNNMSADERRAYLLAAHRQLAK